MKDLFNNALKNAIRAQPDWDESSNPWRMSATGHCSRKLGFQMSTIEPKPHSARTILRFKLGHSIHSDIQEALRWSNLESGDFESEYSLDVPLFKPHSDKSVSLTGHIDGIIHINDKPYILEIKSISDAGFKRIKYQDKYEVESSYACQHECYRRATGFDGIFLFYNKNTSDIEVFESHPNPAAWYQVQSTMTKLYEFSQSSEPIPPESMRDYGPVQEKKRGKPTGRIVLPWQCSYCDYLDPCWPKNEVLIEKGKPVVIPETINTTNDESERDTSPGSGTGGDYGQAVVDSGPEST